MVMTDEEIQKWHEENGEKEKLKYMAQDAAQSRERIKAAKHRRIWKVVDDCLYYLKFGNAGYYMEEPEDRPLCPFCKRDLTEEP